MKRSLCQLFILLATLFLTSCEKFRVAVTEGDITQDSSPAIKQFRLAGTYSDSTHYLHTNGKLYSWGANWDGQLGDRTTNDSHIPVQVDVSHLSLTNNFKTLSSTGYYNYQVCAIHQTGKLLCWGSNYSGECGDGNFNTLCTEPTLVVMSHLSLENNFLMVSVGQEKTCALHANKKIYCWGLNSGLLGTGDSANKLLPTEIDMSLNSDNNEFKYVSVSETNGCGVHENGKVYCWGSNWSGQLGLGTSGMGTDSNRPVEINMSAHLEGNDFVAVAAGYHSCGIHSNGKLFCWGENGNGELGIGSTTDSSLPVEVDMSLEFKINSFTDVNLSSNSTCAIHADKSLYCWGDNGQPAISGSATQENRPFPYSMSPLSLANRFTAMSVDSEGWVICGIHENAKVYCSGKNTDGELGNNSTTNSPTPVAVDMSMM